MKRLFKGEAYRPYRLRYINRLLLFTVFLENSILSNFITSLFIFRND
ncbi:MAG: hypothetical protein LBH59_05900 [Planctomycetaceae bacterium]|nr:hypothetical protein [Planctomycetaceae bacterium]